MDFGRETRGKEWSNEGPAEEERESSSYVEHVVRQMSKENLEEVEPVTCCAAATRKAAARGFHCHQTDQTNLLEMS